MYIYDKFVNYSLKAYSTACTLVAGFELFRALEFYQNDKPEVAAGTALFGVVIGLAGQLPRLYRWQTKRDEEMGRSIEMRNLANVVDLQQKRKKSLLEDKVNKANMQ